MHTCEYFLFAWLLLKDSDKADWMLCGHTDCKCNQVGKNKETAGMSISRKLLVFMKMPILSLCMHIKMIDPMYLIACQCDKAQSCRCLILFKTEKNHFPVKYGIFYGKIILNRRTKTKALRTFYWCYIDQCAIFIGTKFPKIILP